MLWSREGKDARALLCLLEHLIWLDVNATQHTAV